MTKSLEQLQQRRRKWVEANQENGFEEGIKRLLTDLYPDNAHFIYELLQNAEDTQASVVRFTLSDSVIEFEHDGRRLFSLADVEAITSIGVSTKRDDPTSIGKFGIGFKAVFAYTNAPEIHSGEFRFCIRDLVVPESNEVKRPSLGGKETRFIFPFDLPKKPSEQAATEIERSLRALGDNTLLFLSHIRKIEYLLPDASLGSIERIDHKDGHIEIRANHPGGTETVTHWLRFQKDVQVIDEDCKHKTCCIALAYRLIEEEDKKKGHSKWRIVLVDRGQVSIYFPAEKETTNLRFHLHAPFASTVARDSVRDCDANHQLRDHLADLVVESLFAIRDQSMLTVNFLAVLPNQEDNLPEFYEPIREALVEAFQEEDLTPTKMGGFAPSTQLHTGPAAISRVIDDDDLALLMGDEHAPPMWAANAPQANQREDRFLDSLDIDVWGWSELVSVIGKPHQYPYLSQHNEENTQHKRRIETWIAEKDDAWLMRFYALLGEACDTHDETMDVGDLRIVRVEGEQGDEHTSPDKAFFSPAERITPPPDISFVKSTVYSTSRSEAQRNAAVSFLKSIGVRPFDAKAVIKLRLTYYDALPNSVEDIHYKDLLQFIAYWKENPTEVNLFTGHAFLLGVSQVGELHWLRPHQLCLDSPYSATGLARLASIHKKVALWDGYQNKLDNAQIKHFIEFLSAVGAMTGFMVEKVPLRVNPLYAELLKDCYAARESEYKISDDYSIVGLEGYLQWQSVSCSKLIWFALIHAAAESSKARYRPNSAYRTREAESQLVYPLKRHAWIPDISGNFRKPQDMTKDDLRSDFPYDDRNGLLTAIGFGENAMKRSEEYKERNQIAQQNGFKSAERMEKWARLEEAGIDPDDILAKYRCPAQPEASVPNPERRRKGVLERREFAPTKESVKRERTIQPGIPGVVAEAKAYLRAKYTNPDGQLICQCCRTEMPFKIGDAHYFEAVQCLRGLGQHYFENRLALCPTCAAMYLHARETDEKIIWQRIVQLDAADNISAVEIPVKLAGREFQLRFVGTHWFDLKTILSR